MNDDIFDPINERKENLEKQRRMASLDVNNLFNEIAESPEKLTTDVAIEIYNEYQYKRNQIFAIFFSKLSTLDEWLDIYRVSAEDALSKQLAKQNIKKCKADNKTWIDLFETEKDQFIERVAIVKLKENCKTLEDWLEIYDMSAYGFETNDLALMKMREVSESYDDWKIVYERAPFGTKTQAIALENLMLTARQRQKEEIDKSEQLRVQNKKSSSDWYEDYKREEDFYSHRRDDAIVNMYLSSDSA